MGENNEFSANVLTLSKCLDLVFNSIPELRQSNDVRKIINNYNAQQYQRKQAEEQRKKAEEIRGINEQRALEEQRRIEHAKHVQNVRNSLILSLSDEVIEDILKVSQHVGVVPAEVLTQSIKDTVSTYYDDRKYADEYEDDDYEDDYEEDDQDEQIKVDISKMTVEEACKYMASLGK